ncbi:AraC family transcriptional regulator [Halolactibacillus miurensis]|uniref:AraC family transcriptional regulator n=1 Tax=Halolactibacillus miurensis TaxID=306541 RepID=A0A1I6P457_9BACI|nr:AraC family transcriptional regulator [Halolactibacillus miurensis]GEM03129.1 AraC family transcriptional regulator [Halolactibacillus miurensis]SFS35006.1 AraC-like ligand binding domain-containing protein [Halolactibacillus miurensis]
MAHDFYQLMNNKKEALSFKLLYITHSEYDKNWHSLTHTHHFTELFYIVSGKGSFVLPTHEISVQKNDLIVINPNVEHTERSNFKDSLEYIALGIEGIAFTLTDNDPYGLFTYQDDQDDILYQLKKLLYEVEKKDVRYEHVCQNIIEILIVKLLRSKKLSIEKSEAKQLSHAIALAKYYMTQNFHDPITLDILARISNINKYYLVHLFKEELGMTPIAYLNNLRINEAKHLLATTTMTVGEISHITGFSSQSFFTQAFKRETSMTPSSYRQQQFELTESH